MLRATVLLVKARSFDLFLLFSWTACYYQIKMIRQYMPTQLKASGHSFVHSTFIVSKSTCIYLRADHIYRNTQGTLSMLTICLHVPRMIYQTMEHSDRNSISPRLFQIADQYMVKTSSTAFTSFNSL